jgi:ribosome recycling factor
MISEIKKEAESKMTRAIEALGSAFNRIRTGRAHPGILDSVTVDYFGSLMPLNQVANVRVGDARCLTISPWDVKMVPAIEKAILKSSLGLNPSSSGNLIRVPMPPLTEETRKNYIKQAKAEAEHARVSIRNVRRDANTHLKALLKDKQVSEDQEHKAQDDVQKLTDKFIAEVEKLLQAKEVDLMEF